MATIIMNIITVVMSISIFFTSTLPAFVSGKDYKIISNNTISTEKNHGLISVEEEISCYEIISSFDELKKYAEKHSLDITSYSEEYFKTKSLIFTEFIINDGKCELQVVNAAERNNTLELHCNIYHYYGMSINYVTYYTLAIETSKNIETVDISINNINIPFEVF